MEIEIISALMGFSYGVYKYGFLKTLAVFTILGNLTLLTFQIL